MKGKSVIFDLDGTLVDSYPGIAFSLQKALTLSGFPRIDKEFIDLIGPPIQKIIQTLMPKCSEDDVQNITNKFRRIYDNQGYKKTFLYPNILDVLEKLGEQKIDLYVLTNKKENVSNKILEFLGVKNLFSKVVGCDSVLGENITSDKKKDRAVWLIKTEKIYKSILIGDGVDDFDSAQEIKADFFLAGWGYGNKKVLKSRKIKNNQIYYSPISILANIQ